MKRLFIISIIIITLASCDLFQLQIQPRDNTKDPGSTGAVLYVLSCSLVDGSEQVDVADFSIIVTFSEALDPDSITSLTFSVSGGGSTMEGSINVDGSTLTFQPTSSPWFGTLYTVTMTTGIAGTAGSTMEQDMVLQFTTRIRQWNTPVMIENIDTGDAWDPEVAVDSDGNAMVVWHHDEGTEYNIYSNRYTAASGWEGAVSIEGYSGDAHTPRIAIGPDGTAFVVWMQYEVSVYNISVNRYIPGTGWEGEIFLESNSGSAQVPDVAVDSYGNATVVWFQDEGGYYNIFAKRYISGTGWEVSDLIESNSGHAFYPEVSCYGNGNCVVVWHQTVSSEQSIFSNRYTTGSGWSGETIIDSDVTFAEDPRVAVDAEGNTLAVWLQGSGTDDNIWANYYDSTDGWEEAELIETGTGDVSDQQIAANGEGIAFAVWTQPDETKDSIWCARYVPGSGWETAELLENDNTGDASDPRIDIAPDGSAVAVWIQSDGTRDNICYNVYTPGSGWAGADLLEHDDDGDADSPRIAADDDNNFLAAWRQSDGTRFNLFAAHYR